jgi:hypothetical protein
LSVVRSFRSVLPECIDQRTEQISPADNADQRVAHQNWHALDPVLPSATAWAAAHPQLR